MAIAYPERVRRCCGPSFIAPEKEADARRIGEPLAASARGVVPARRAICAARNPASWRRFIDVAERTPRTPWQ